MSSEDGNDGGNQGENSGKIPANARIPWGTLEDAKKMIGRRSETRFGPDPVNWARIRQFCAVVHDGNASYWDEDFARAQWGGIISPPAMIEKWTMPVDWYPGIDDPERVRAREKNFKPFNVPLPANTMINAGTEMEFYLPARVGEALNVDEELVDISDEKETRLGVGYFVTTRLLYRREDGTPVAKVTNSQYRFTPKAK